jgi:hypothetical protein
VKIWLSPGPGLLSLRKTLVFPQRNRDHRFGMAVRSGPFIGVGEGLNLNHRSGEIIDPHHPS